jgi:hypothetical protein
MKKSQAEPTTAKNLEDKFDRGEDVLDYFEVTEARIRRSGIPIDARRFAKNERVIAKRPG